MTERFAIITGIPTDDLMETVRIQQDEGWNITEQNYMGSDLWEILLIKDPAIQPLDAA